MANLFSKWREGLQRTSQATFGRLASMLGATEITEETWEELEALLIQADVGVETTQDLLQVLRRRVRDEGLRHSDALQRTLREELLRRLPEPPEIKLTSHPAVILIVGVNGSGKTTTIAKLGWRFLQDGKRCFSARRIPSALRRWISFRFGGSGLGSR